MTYQTVNNVTNIKPQTIPNFKRKGFTVVEWGGSQF